MPESETAFEGLFSQMLTVPREQMQDFEPRFWKETKGTAILRVTNINIQSYNQVQRYPRKEEGIIFLSVG
jgi:hypothetical protein